MNKKLHHFMLTFLASFKGPEGQAGMKYVNLNVQRVHKTIPLGTIKLAQDSVVAQLSFFGVPAENVVDVTFISSSYLGLMTEKELHEGLNQQDMEQVATAYESEEAVTQNPFDKV